MSRRGEFGARSSGRLVAASPRCSTSSAECIGDYDGRSTASTASAMPGPIRRSAWCSRKSRRFPGARSIENVAFPLEVAGVKQATSARARARELVDPRRSLRLRRALSGRSCRVACGSASALARTLASSRAYLLMDEPFAALDEQTRAVARRQDAADPAGAETDDPAHHAQHRRSGAALRPGAGHDLSGPDGSSACSRSSCRARARRKSSAAAAFAHYVARDLAATCVKKRRRG